MHRVLDGGLPVATFAYLGELVRTAFERFIEKDGCGACLEFSAFGFEEEINDSLCLMMRHTFFMEYAEVRGLKMSATSVWTVALMDSCACLISILSVISCYWLSDMIRWVTDD